MVFLGTDPNIDVTLTDTLLLQIQRYWPQLLQSSHLEVSLQQPNELLPLAAEVFIGDTFRRADRWYVDVVIRPAAEAGESAPLPSVLVFEKQPLRLVQAELNELSLNCRCELMAVAAAQ